mgnify:CR=1 FL=1
MNFSKIKENALKYLGYHHQILDEKMNVLIDECIEEIEKMSSFRVTYRKFPLSFHPLRIDEISLNLDYPDLNDLFQNCHDVVIIACTLRLQVENLFDRITLVNREKTERLTIDTGLSFRNLSSGKEQSLPGLVIIELKQDGNIPSHAKACLSQLHIHPVSISKYCLGTLLTNPDAKRNRFKKKLTQINKLANYSYGYIL